MANPRKNSIGSTRYGEPIICPRMAVENNPPALSKRQIFFRRLFSFVLLWTIILAALLKLEGHAWLSGRGVPGLIMVMLAAAGLAEILSSRQKAQSPLLQIFRDNRRRAVDGWHIPQADRASGTSRIARARQ